MGTDIHPAVEVRRKGIWRYHRPTEECRWYGETWTEEAARDYNERVKDEHPDWVVKAGDRRNPWDRCKTRLPDCFKDRNYAKFAVLGDVRNGYGFAGVPTFVPITPISSDRGMPYDISKEAKAKLSHEHSPGWVTLQELEDYDFTKPQTVTGVVTERQFLEHYVMRKDPENWSGGISGQNIEVLTPERYVGLFAKEDGWKVTQARTYDHTKRYYIQLAWEVPIATSVPDILEMIAYLRPLVPKGGTPDDVRVVFDFDS